MYCGCPTGFEHFLVACRYLSVPHIVHDGVVKENRALWHDTDALPKATQVSDVLNQLLRAISLYACLDSPEKIDIADVLAINADASAGDVVEPVKKLQQSRLASSRCAYKCYRLASVNV